MLILNNTSMEKISLRSVLGYASVLGLFSFVVCFLWTREEASIREKKDHSMITPKVLNKLAQCFDNFDGIVCYSRYRSEMIEEFKRNLKIDSVTMLEK